MIIFPYVLWLCGLSSLSYQFRIHNTVPDGLSEIRADHSLIFELLLSRRDYGHTNLVGEALYLIAPYAGPLYIPL